LGDLYSNELRKADDDPRLYSVQDGHLHAVQGKQIALDTETTHASQPIIINDCQAWRARMSTIESGRPIGTMDEIAEMAPMTQESSVQ
jgi:hypothetical protein